MKKFVIIITLLLFSKALFAQNKNAAFLKTDMLRIEILGTKSGTIKIGNATYKSKQKFCANEVIHWTSEKEYMQVNNTRTGLSYNLPAKAFLKAGPNTTPYILLHHTYSKAGISQLKMMGDSVLGKRHYMVNNDLRIFSSLPLNDSCYYVVKAIPGNKEAALQYDDETNELYISQSYLKDSLGVCLDEKNNTVRLHVEYVENNNVIYPLTDSFLIEYIPLIK